jgi:hypothetical protein
VPGWDLAGPLRFRTISREIDELGIEILVKIRYLVGPEL